MKNRLSLIVWSVALGLVATGARADGIAEAPAAACCGTASFAGLYVGGAIGGGQHREKVTNTSPGAPAEGLTFKDTDNNFTFGGYVGYNFQRCCSPLVFGIEADFNYLNSKPRASDVEPQIVGFPVETTNLESKIDWFGTLRGRAGFVVHDHVLLYATAGLAYARVEHTLSDDCVGCGDPINPQNLGTFLQSNSKTKVGWTIGGGGEMLHDEHWVLRAEALYVDLGSESHSYDGPGIASSSADWDDQFWVARLGISYKFDSPDCCAAPMK